MKHKKSRRKQKVKQHTMPNRNYYVINQEFEYFYELRDLILKSSRAQKDKIRQGIRSLGRIKFAVIAGILLEKENPDPMSADLLIVADDLDRRKLRGFLKSCEADVGKEIKFAIMDLDEFKYRLGMFDRFIRVLLEGPHEKLINLISVDLP